MFKDFIKKQTVASWLVCGGALLGLVAVIIFLVNSTTGYMAGQKINALIPICTFLAIALAVVVIILYDRIKKFADIGIIVAVMLLCLSVALFILSRTNIFADVYFIPVNYPQAEADAVNGSIVGAVFYILSIGALVAGSFFERLTKD